MSERLLEVADLSVTFRTDRGIVRAVDDLSLHVDEGETLAIVGVAIFGLASLASGFAQEGAWLITARAIQGIGAAVIFPVSMAMITNAFPAEQRGMALGIQGAIGTIFLSLGPLAGGFFTETLSWRWIFWINPPIVAVIAGGKQLAATDELLGSWCVSYDRPGATERQLENNDWVIISEDRRQLTLDWGVGTSADQIRVLVQTAH